jgi:hypothetical protein
MLRDHAVASVTEDSLWNILPEIHKANLGHLSRVIRPSKRSSLLDQLRRAGVPVTQAPDRVAASEVILLVSAAARSERTAALAVAHGANRAWVVNTLGAWIEMTDTVLAAPPATPSPLPPLVVPGRGTLPSLDPPGPTDSGDQAT